MQGEHLMDKQELKELNLKFGEKSAQEVLNFAISEIGISRLLFASSLSIEDQVVTDMLMNVNKDVRIFFIDTGRHFQKTYDLMDATMSKYKFKYEVYAPNGQDLEKLISQSGPNLFYDSQELRKKCCYVRKVEPLKRALSAADAWICGLRRDQSVTRNEVNLFEWDSNYSVFKINPLAQWTEEMVWDYIKRENVPYNNLYDKGFRSIGCQPCTRAVHEGEDIRSGRWWWEDPDKKECGLHVQKKEKE